MQLPRHLLLAYTATRYTVAGIDLRIGRRSRQLDGLLAGMGVREAAFVTACNPRGVRAPAGRNDRMMARMRGRLGTITALPGSGATKTWSEAHFVVAGDVRRLAVLARSFRQNAIVRLRRGQGPCLIPLG